MSWGSRRQGLYLGSGLILLLVAGTLFYFLVIYRAPSCMDGVKNGSETGVDCGGNCQNLCPAETLAPTILWSRSFEVAPGVWNAAAYVENHNGNAGARQLRYRFRIFEAGNVLIVERVGMTFLAPGSAAVIVEPSMLVGERKPLLTQFEFLELPQWEKISDGAVPDITVQSSELTNAETLPRISAVARNRSLFDVAAVEATAIVYDAEDNAIAVSKTLLPSLQRGEEKQIVFTWPKPFTTSPTRIDVRARASFK